MSEKAVKMEVRYPDSSAGGVKHITKSGADGVVRAFPKAISAQVCQELERNACVYVLWSPGGAKPKVYVGESDDMATRINQHRRKKTFWTHAAVFTGEFLDNKAALNFQAWLCQNAQEAKRCELRNKQKPKPRPYADKTDENVVRQKFNDLCRFFLPLAGCDFFNPAMQSALAPTARAKPAATFAVAGKNVELSLLAPRSGVEAHGRDTEIGFVVYKGSKAAKETAGSFDNLPHHPRTRDGLIKEKILVKGKDGLYRFSCHHPFTSASSAASIVLGRNANGKNEWKDAEGRTLGKLQEQ